MRSWRQAPWCGRSPGAPRQSCRIPVNGLAIVGNGARRGHLRRREGFGAEAQLAVDPPLPDALVEIAKVSNGCGGGKAGKPGWLQTFGANTSTYLNSNIPLGKRYTVDFSDACDLHDAGYSGAKVRDKLNGGIIDYFEVSKQDVDEKFWEDQTKLCLRAIPEAAPVARDDCMHRGGVHLDPLHQPTR